jgi:hypothetical protein
VTAEASKWRQQLQLWLILGITAGVLAGGFLLLPRDHAGRARLLSVLGTSNHGILLSPVVPMAGLRLVSPAGAAEDWSRWAPHWRVVIAAAMPCGQPCREALYLTRQVHVRLARNAGRVERVLLAVDDALDAELAALLEREHPRLRTLLVAPAEFAHWPGAGQMHWTGGEPRIFVVDPQGAAILYFTPEHEGADLLEDLNHLLKYSPEP